MKSFTLRIDDELRRKFHYVAKYEGRSSNGQLMVMIRKYVEDYEKEHGEITEADLAMLDEQ